VYVNVGVCSFTHVSDLGCFNVLNTKTICSYSLLGIWEPFVLILVHVEIRETVQLNLNQTCSWSLALAIPCSGLRS
jgi:hypothetical protein